MKQFGFPNRRSGGGPRHSRPALRRDPELTTADIRPFVWAILLYRGAVKKHEVVGSVTPLCAHSELYSAGLMIWTQMTTEPAWSGLWTRFWVTGPPAVCCITAPRATFGS